MKTLESFLTCSSYIISREEIYRYLYPEDAQFSSNADEVIEVKISRLRKIFAGVKDPCLLKSIETITGFRYKWLNPLKQEAMIIPEDVQISPNWSYSFRHRAVIRGDSGTGKIRMGHLSKEPSQMLEALIFDQGRVISYQEFKELLINPKCDVRDIEDNCIWVIKEKLARELKNAEPGLSDSVVNRWGFGYLWTFHPVPEAESSVSGSPLFSTR